MPSPVQSKMTFLSTLPVTTERWALIVIPSRPCPRTSFWRISKTTAELEFGPTPPPAPAQSTRIPDSGDGSNTFPEMFGLTRFPATTWTVSCPRKAYPAVPNPGTPAPFPLNRLLRMLGIDSLPMGTGFTASYAKYHSPPWGRERKLQLWITGEHRPGAAVDS